MKLGVPILDKYSHIGIFCPQKFKMYYLNAMKLEDLI